MGWPFRKRTDDSAALACYQRGMEHLRADRATEAVADLEQAVQLGSANAEFLKDLGNAQRAAGRLDDAIASYRRSLDLAPDNVAALYNLGLTQRETGQFAEAEQRFRRVHEIEPGDVDALFHLAALLSERAQFAESVQMYRKAVALAPDNPYLWMGLAIACQAISGQREESLRCLQKCAELYGDLADLWAGLRQHPNQSLSPLPPSADDDLINRAATLAHAGTFDEALLLLERAAQINPRNPRLEPHRGRIRFLISRSIDPKVPGETRAMLETVESMNRELNKKPLYSPGEFWRSIGDFHVELLRRYGVENFKRTVSHHYQNWLMISIEDAQVRRLLETWAGHRSMDPFVNTVESPDHVGYHLTRDFDGAEYPLAKESELEVYRFAVGLLWEHVLQGDRKGILESLEELGVGNPIRIHRQGRLISSDLAHSVRERTLLLDHLNLTGQEGLVIGELGAGYGRLAEAFGRTTNYRYFIFDIAPTLYVSQWYIKKIFPNEKVFSFRSFDDWAQVRDEVAASRFAFFTANQIELIPSASLDLFINMNSLMEMKMEQIQNFLTHISRLTTRSFLSRQYLRWRNHLDDLTVGKDDFVMADGWRKTLDCVDDIHPEFFNQIWERKQAASPQPG